LAVNETNNRGWWIPGGAVDGGESFQVAALRECFEEASVKIALKGVLRVEHSLMGYDEARMRVIFYAEPIDDK
jgi:ADP-ribose pyrophosphatase YjhB (NUDIX family)